MVEGEQVPQSKQVLIAGYLSRDLRNRLKSALARQEMTFSGWLRAHADRWLTELNQPHDQGQE